MIYFIKTGEAVKIGYTQDVEARLKTYRTHNPDVTLLRVIPGDKDTEKFLHDKLKIHRTTGEWFTYNENVRSTIEAPELDKLSEEVERVTKHVEGDSFRTYYAHGSAITKLKYAADMNIAIKFATMARYNEGIIHLTIQSRKDMINELGLHSSNVSKSLKRLVDANIIHGEKGSYLLNPLYFWRGDTRGRNEILDNKQFQTAFNFELC